ncbi:MAG TPA: hypothetical protein VHY20_10660 [Pirellulales bacterium]|jgi:hypothetical protein|nr:hypothetical protein [Pirellulales bacterium]
MKLVAIVMLAALIGAGAVFAAELLYCSYFAVEHPWKSFAINWLR